MLHIYTEAMQPATNWTDTHSCEPMQMGFEPDKLIYAHCCGQQRGDTAVHGDMLLPANARGNARP
jgi:hypothetical protein